jgi:glycine cleavage system H protein
VEFVRYRHAHFSARFPRGFRYARSHYWMAPADDDPGVCRVGFTKFATRMLGELVEANFEVSPGDPVTAGQPIGSVEGFKAAADVFCALDGEFAGGNPVLDIDACIVKSDPYTAGWLYAVRGQPGSDSLDADGYIELLDETIRKMQAERDDANNAG